MGTKNDPGDFDCYEKAEPDEPMFVILARDPVAPLVVRHWALLRELRGLNKTEDKQVLEAQICAANMATWRREHRGAEGE